MVPVDPMTEIRRWILRFDEHNEGPWDEIIADGSYIDPYERVKVIEAKVTDEMVDLMRIALGSKLDRLVFPESHNAAIREALEKVISA